MLMTGPAQCAWIIGAILASMYLPCHARAATPRDAVANMPSITHTSAFTMTESSTPFGQGFEDDYTGTWEVHWVPPSVALGDKAGASLDLYYSSSLVDNLNRIAHSSYDSRSDLYRFGATVNAPSFSASYSLSQGDSWSGSDPWSSHPAWQPQRDSSLNLAWTPLGLPRLGIYNKSSQSYGSAPAGTQQQGSESDYTVLNASFAPPAGAFGQSYTAQTEYFRSRNYAAGTSTRWSKNYLDGWRELPLGAMGSLNANYHFEQTSNSGPGVVQSSTSTTNVYGLSVAGGVANMPLGYRFTYQNGINEFPGGNGDSRQYRYLELDFNPPVPAGKSASMSYFTELTDYATEPRGGGAQTTDEKQHIGWSFSPNPRVSGRVMYESTNRTNVLAHAHPTASELVNASMGYTIPGKRGSFSGAYAQNIQRSPEQGARLITTTVDLRNNFQMGPLASMQMFMIQLYSDNYDSPLSVATGNDKLTTGFTYTLNSPYGLWLSTTWQQDFTRYAADFSPAGSTTNIGTLNVNLNFQPPGTAWNYSLALNTHDDSKSSVTNVGDNTYASYNTISARVSYSF